MDAFSQILSGVKLNGAVFFRAEFSAPWGFSTPTAKVMTATHAPGAEHLVLYHLVIQGGAFIELLDGESLELSPGDVVVFPHGDPHHMSSGKGADAAVPELRHWCQDPVARSDAFVCGRWRRHFPVRVWVYDV